MRTRLKFTITASALLIFLMSISAAWAGTLIINGTSSLTINGGTLDVNCNDITVNSGGTLDLQTGSILDKRNLSVDPSGTYLTGTGTIIDCGKVFYFIHKPGGNPAIIALPRS